MNKDRIWDVLVEHGGAQESMRENFKASWPECREYRFQGNLGFGGKVWFRAHYPQQVDVNCYKEDETPERYKIIATINALLAAEAKP